MVAGSTSRGRPHLCHGKATCAVKDEDVIFLREHVAVDGSKTEYSFYCICDGHNGAAAARFVEDNLVTGLMKRLPSSNVPKKLETPEARFFANKINEALVEVLEEIDDSWRSQGVLSGTTVTVAVVMDCLLTVANIGDSLGFLQTSGKVYPMTADHRLQTSPSEVNRLQKAGVLVARVSQDLDGPSMVEDVGVGPMRAWPGGLAVGRSLGDIDARPEVVCRPHIKQVIVPVDGGRLILASDGLWDLLNPKRVMLATKNMSVESAPSKLVERARKAGGGVLPDDTSVLVLDILPDTKPDFASPRVGQKLRGCLCMAPGMADDFADIQVISNMDSLHWYPLALRPMGSPGSKGRDLQDLTVHHGRGYGQSEPEDGLDMVTSPFECEAAKRDPQHHVALGSENLARFDSAIDVLQTSPPKLVNQVGKIAHGVIKYVANHGDRPKRLDSAQDF